MKKTLPTILLGLSLTTLLGFDVGQEVELTTFLNGRANPNFLKYTKNVQTLLDKGTTGEVVEVKKFSSGNSGIKMKVNSGPKSGESYWVYYNKADPAIKLTDEKSKKEVTPDAAKLNQTNALVKREIAASRDLDEHAVIETARAAAKDLDAKKINEATSLQAGNGCKQDAVTVSRPKVPASAGNAEIPPQTPPRTPLRDASEPYTAQSALEELNSEELKFVGRDLMPGSGQNRSCIFQNSKVVVIYDNCMGNKKEAAVTDVRIISKAGGEVSFYVENASSKVVSKMKRSEYDSTWRVSYAASKAPGTTNVAGIKKYMEDNENNTNYCFIGTSFAAKSDAKAICSDTVSGDKGKWISETESFWSNPPETWYTTQAKLRRLVEKAPY